MSLFRLSQEETNATVERLLADFRYGNLSDSELIAALNRDIRKLAQLKLRNELPNHTLQATEVANLVYLRIASNPRGTFALHDAAHLIHLPGKLIDNVLPDHARRKRP